MPHSRAVGADLDGPWMCVATVAVGLYDIAPRVEDLVMHDYLALLSRQVSVRRFRFEVMRACG